MNGDTNGTMGEPLDTAVANEQDSIPEPKKVNTESLLNGTNCENSSSIEDGSEDENHKDKVIATLYHLKVNSDDNLVDSQDNDTNNTDDHPEDFQEIKSDNGEDPSMDSHKDDSNDGSLGQKDSQDSVNNSDECPEDAKSQNNEVNQDSQDTVNNSDECPEDTKSQNNEVNQDSQDTINNSDECPEDTKLQSNEANHIDDSLANCQDEEGSNSNNLHQLSEQENSNNGLESNQNSDDESSETGEDTVGYTISSGETERQQKLDDGEVKTETFKIVTINEHHSDDEMESLNSDYSGSEGELKAEDTVSLNSDSNDLPTTEDFNDNGEFNKSSELIILENDGTNNHNGTSKSPEIHEIISDNDDCVMTAEEKLIKKTKITITGKTKKAPKAVDSKVELRRSSRTIKRKKYDDDVQPLDDESDIEEVVMEDPLKRKSKNIFINTTKTLVDMTGKHGKSNTYQKKDSTIVIIDSPTKNPIPISKASISTLNQSIYQRITSRGTSVTPVGTNNTIKNMTTQGTQVSPTPPPPILPTLTDDMFVVEAPSFIVPYVYEKPAILPFKEFVDKWGKEIEEEKAKEDQALLEKKKEEKAKREQEKQEKRDRGEEVVDSEEESEEIKKKKAAKAEKKEKRRQKKEDDDVSWDGSSSSESEDDDISDDDVNNAKNKGTSIGEGKDVTSNPLEPTRKPETYFDLFLGKFFMNIGMNLVQEYVQTDLLKQQNRKLQREKKGGHDLKDRELSIALLTKNLELSQKTNAPFTFEQIKCEFCTFKTESALTLAQHLETPHMKKNLYKCNFCTFEIRSPHDILYHMETKHNVKGRLERTPALHQCANCPFEDHGKGKLARHLIACAKKFKPDSNLAPPLEWEHPAKIAKVQRARGNAAPYQVSQFGRNHVDGGAPRLPIPIASGAPPQSMYRARGRGAPRASAPLPAPARASGLLIRHSAGPQLNYALGNAKKAMHPSISITPLPRHTAFPSPVPVQPLHGAKGFVICEICDGYIKDLEQLRNHMQWIHKVKIHPKMIYNRPPLNCQKCQFRFFTDQGLERHLLGSHGLVTSSMQEAANRGKDAGRCPVCGRVYQWKLLGHVSREHNLVLKPAHLSYKCTVCTATFGMYRQFENHVYSAHSVVANKLMDKKTPAAANKPNANDTAAKQLKINDEITIIPQPIKMPGATKEK